MRDPQDAPGSPPVPGSRLLSRTQAAERLGMSERTFRRNIEGKELDAHVDERGYHRFDEASVIELAAERGVAAGGVAVPVAVADDLGARVFDLLAEGVAPVEIVTRLRASPAAVEALHAQWVRMRGGLVLSGDVLAELTRLVAPSSAHVLTSEGALLMYAQAALARLTQQPSATCGKCARRSAVMCASCAAMTGRDLAEERAQKEHEARMAALDREQAAARERYRRDEQKAAEEHARELAARSRPAR